MRDRRLIGHAKQMRQQLSPFETTLWRQLRADRFAGAKFRRQVVIGRYIADFACRRPRMLVIEADGDTHAAQANYDSTRTEFLESKGYRVLRFSNRDIGSNIEAVLSAISDALTLPLSPTLSPEGEREKGDQA